MEGVSRHTGKERSVCVVFICTDYTEFISTDCTVYRLWCAGKVLLRNKQTKALLRKKKQLRGGREEVHRCLGVQNVREGWEGVHVQNEERPEC
jgi:hypothetical protein